jgi:hypothetical protein
MRRALVPSLFLLTLAALPAAAQESGGLGLSREALSSGGPRGLARPLPFTFPSITASDLQSTPTPAQRRQQHQDMIARVRGDGGLLDGFSFGQPRAASRQRPLPPPPDPVFAPVFVDASTFVDQRTKVVNRVNVQERTRVVNRFEAPVAVTVGNGNVVQQQGAGGAGKGAANGAASGPVAQQQVATIGGRTVRGPGGAAAGGATNLVTAEGNIIQRAPQPAGRARP